MAVWEEGSIKGSEGRGAEVVAHTVLGAREDGTCGIRTDACYVDLVKTRDEGMVTVAMPPIPHPI